MFVIFHITLFDVGFIGMNAGNKEDENNKEKNAKKKGRNPRRRKTNRTGS
jgi:hypothetical protein